MSLWAKRKAAVAAEAWAEEAARQAAARQAEDQALAERSDEELLAEAGLKAPEDLADAAEIRDFLRHAVPERLKRRALRRLWGTNPVLACLDGLNDYDEDYTDAAGTGDPVQTAYVVGKGMVGQFQAFVAGDHADAEPVTDAATSDPELPPSRTCSGTSTSDVADGDSDAVPPDQIRDGEVAVAALSQEDAADALAPAHRRMRFTFESPT